MWIFRFVFSTFHSNCSLIFCACNWQRRTLPSSIVRHVVSLTNIYFISLFFHICSQSCFRISLRERTYFSSDSNLCVWIWSGWTDVWTVKRPSDGCCVFSGCASKRYKKAVLTLQLKYKLFIKLSPLGSLAFLLVVHSLLNHALVHKLPKLLTITVSPVVSRNHFPPDSTFIFIDYLLQQWQWRSATCIYSDLVPEQTTPRALRSTI